MDRAEILAEYRALPAHRRHEALAVACRDALEIWRAFRAGGEDLVYIDSVVGERHVVEDSLPERALAAVDAVLSGQDWDGDLVHAYREPIVAMQDADLELPDAVELAYYAIYNLFQLATGQPHAAEEELVLRQVASAVDVDLDDWLREWRTRVWDAWVRDAELAPGLEPLPAAVFDALDRGDLAAAIERAPEDGCVRAVLLALAGRRAEAVDAALAALGPGAPELRAWLDDHVERLVPEALAADAGWSSFAAISGERVIACARGTGARLRSASFGGSELARVRFDGDAVWVAGVRVDPIGAWAAFWDALDGGETFTARGELRGAHRIAALGPGLVVLRSDRELRVIGIDGRDTLAGVRVDDAAVSDDATVIATRDEVSVSIWDRERGTVETLPGDARRLVFGGRRLLVAWADGTASLHAT